MKPGKPEGISSLTRSVDSHLNLKRTVKFFFLDSIAPLRNLVVF